MNIAIIQKLDCSGKLTDRYAASSIRSVRVQPCLYQVGSRKSMQMPVIKQQNSSSTMFQSLIITMVLIVFSTVYSISFLSLFMYYRQLWNLPVPLNFLYFFYLTSELFRATFISSSPCFDRKRTMTLWKEDLKLFCKMKGLKRADL